MLAALQERLQALDSVTLYCPSLFTEIDIETERVLVSLEDGRSLSAPLLAAADGAAAAGVTVRLYIGVSGPSGSRPVLAAQAVTDEASGYRLLVTRR